MFYCFYCGLSCQKSRPIPVGTNMKLIGQEPQYEVEAVCCYPTCAMSYINLTKFKKWEKEQNLYQICEILLDKRPGFIEESPDKYKMRRYGGELSDDQYLEQLREINIYEE